MPRRGQRRDPERERFWRRTMKAWARSGQSLRAYCRERGLSEWTAYRWRRELRKHDGERVGTGGGAARTRQARSTAAPRPDARGPALRPRFLPVRLTAGPAPIEIERNGTTIRLTGDVDPEVLVRLLEAVGRVPC